MLQTAIMIRCIYGLWYGYTVVALYLAMCVLVWDYTVVIGMVIYNKVCFVIIWRTHLFNHRVRLEYTSVVKGRHGYTRMHPHYYRSMFVTIVQSSKRVNVD